MAWWAIAIAIVSAGASYVQAKKAQKKAQEMSEGVETNIESNSKEIPVIYGERRVGGTRVYIDTSRDQKHEYLYMALVMAEGKVTSIDDIKIDDISINDPRFDGVVTSSVHLGDDNQPVSALIKNGTMYDNNEDVWVDPYQQYHDEDDLVPSVVYPWGDNHRLRGVAYLALKFKWDENAFQGIPDVTAVVKGKQVYNPNTGVTEWSDNPALCIRDYLTNTRYGKGLPESAIDDTAFIAAMNDLNNFTITPYTGATADQKLFTMNHVVDTSKTILDNLNDMLLSCRAFLPYSNGVYSLKIDQPSASVMNIGADQIISGIAISGAKKEDRFNQVKVNFFNKAQNFKEDTAVYPESDTGLYETYLSEDEGEPLIDEVDCFSINNYYSAREMARLFLERSRQNMTIAFQGTSELINLEVGEVVSVTHPTPDWTNKLFQVQEVALAFDGTVQITCIEYDAALYTYDTPEVEQPFVGSRLPDPTQVDPVTALTTTAGTYLEADGTATGYIDLSWTPPRDSLVDRYEVKFEYSSKEEVIEIASSEYRLKPTQDNVSYVISVRAVNGLGIRSAWLTAAAVTAVVDTTAPSDITGINISAGLQSITLDWTNPSENDFDLVRIKHNTVDELPSSHSFEVRSDSFVHDIGAYSTTKHYWLAPVDRTGNIGNYVSGGSATTGSIDYSDVGNTPTIPQVATTAYLTLADDDAPTDIEFSTAVGRDPIENDFVVVSYEALIEGETVTRTKAYVYKTVSPAEVPDWTEVAEYIDGSMLVSGSLSASDITTGTLNASMVTIENLTVSYSTLTDKPTIPVNVSDLTNDSGFIDDTNVVFSDDLDDYIRLDSVENLLLSFDKYADQETNIDWTGYDNTTSDIKVVKSADAVTGGSYLEIGNNSGNDEAWLIHNKNIPFDPSQTYRVTVRAKQTAGTGIAAFGFAGIASDGVTLVNYEGNNSYSAQHYFAGNGVDVPTAWTEYVGYVKGVSTTGTLNQRDDYNNPAVMHEDTRFVRPIIIVNYDEKAGITLIDSFKIEAISANPNAIQGNEVDANVTQISGGVIQAGSQITVGTGNDIGALSGSDSTFRIWAGHATASSAPFKVSQAGVLNATGAVIDGNITAESLDVENATVTGTFIAPIGWSDNVYSGVINRGNLNESVKDLIDERIAEVTGGISGDFGQDDGLFSYIAQGNPDPDNPIVLNITHGNGKDLTVELSGSRSWNRQFIGLPDTDMGVTIILERSPAGANTWTTLTTLTDAGSSITTSGPTLIHSSTYAYSISIYHVLTDDQASGNYDYRARTTVAGSAYSVGVPIQLTVVEPATVGAGNADTLDNEDGTYYLNYNNFTNTPDLSTKANLSGATFTGDVVVGSDTTRIPIQVKSETYAEVHFFTNGTEYTRIGTAEGGSYGQEEGDFYVYGAGRNKMHLIVPKDGSALKRENGTITIWDSSNFANNSSNWDTAYSWGDHSTQGYITSIDTPREIAYGNSTISGSNSFRLAGTGIQTRFSLVGYNEQDTEWEWRFTQADDANPVPVNVMTLTPTSSTSANLSVTGTLSASGYNNANWDTAYSWGDHSALYIPKGGSWNAVNMPGSRWNGFSVNSGEVVFQRDNPNTGQMSVMVDGNFYAGENNGFWSLYSGNDYNLKVGFTSNSSGHFLVSTSSLYAGGNEVFHAGNFATGSDNRSFDVLTADRFLASGADLTPAGTTFSNTLKGNGTARTIYFDGHNGSVSTWYGVGNNPFSAIDVTEGMMDFYVNPSNGSWYSVFDITTSGLNITTGGLMVSGNQVIDASRNLTNIGTIENGSVWINDGSNYNNYNENIRLFDPANNGPSVIAFGATGVGGSPRHSILSYADDTNGFDFRIGTSSKMRLRSAGVDVKGGGFLVDATTVIDSSRNLTNIGTGSFSGNINVTNGGNPQIIATSTSGASDSTIKAQYSNGLGIEMRYDPNLAECFFDSTYPTLSGTVFGDIIFRQKVGSTMVERLRFDNDAAQAVFSQSVAVNGSLLSNGNWQTTGNLITINTSTYAVFIADGGLNQWKYLSLQTNGATKWDIACNENDLSGSLQFRPNGSSANVTYVNTTGLSSPSFSIDGTTVISSSRNLINITSATVSDLSVLKTGNNYLKVTGNGAYEAMTRYDNSTSNYWYTGIRTSTQLVGNTGYHIYSSAAGQTVFGLTAGGEMRAKFNVIAYYSDDRLKTKVGKLDNALSKVCSLNGFIYVENEKAKELGYDSNREQVGLSAQEVQNVLPQAVRLAPVDCEIDEDGNDKSISGEDYLTLDYAKVVPLLVEAIKELKQEIEELKNGTNSN